MTKSAVTIILGIWGSTALAVIGVAVSGPRDAPGAAMVVAFILAFPCYYTTMAVLRNDR